MWKALAWLRHFTKSAHKTSLAPAFVLLNWFGTARKVNGRVFVCYRYQICLFLLQFGDGAVFVCFSFNCKMRGMVNFLEKNIILQYAFSHRVLC